MSKNLLNLNLVIDIFVLFIVMNAVSVSTTQIDKNYIIPYKLGNTLYVGGEGPENFTQIQDAINHAYEGNTIFVYNGIYKEHLIIKKKINLIGENKNTTIIQGKNEDEDLVHVEANMVNISGFTIQHSTDLNYGIYISDSKYCYILNCNLRYINSKDAIYLRNSNNNKIINCSISNSAADICISNSQDNTVSNCNLKGSKSGIDIIYSSNNIISNCCLDKGSLLIRDSSENIISKCKIFNHTDEATFGIQISYSKNCTFRNNTLENLGIIFNVNFPYEYYHDIDVSNKIDGKPIYYLIEESNKEFNEKMDIGYFGLISCKNITVKNLTLHGIVLGNTSYATIKNCYFNQNLLGLDIGLSKDNIVTNCDFLTYNSVRIRKSLNNIISDCRMPIGGENGICVDINYYSSQNKVSNCSINNFDTGIIIGGESHNNTIVDCNITNNDYYGVWLTSQNNKIVDCSISYNDYYGVWLISSNNIIYHNNILYNSLNAYDEGKNNIWDDGKYGNYWSDYEESYPNAKPKLFKPWMWNTPYEIQGGSNKDNCPLVNQWPKSKTKDILKNRIISSSLLLRFLEQYQLIQYILQRLVL